MQQQGRGAAAARQQGGGVGQGDRIGLLFDAVAGSLIVYQNERLVNLLVEVANGHLALFQLLCLIVQVDGRRGFLVLSCFPSLLLALLMQPALTKWAGMASPRLCCTDLGAS